MVKICILVDSKDDFMSYYFLHEKRSFSRFMIKNNLRVWFWTARCNHFTPLSLTKTQQPGRVDRFYQVMQKRNIFTKSIEINWCSAGVCGWMVIRRRRRSPVVGPRRDRLVPPGFWINFFLGSLCGIARKQDSIRSTSGVASPPVFHNRLTPIAALHYIHHRPTRL